MPFDATVAAALPQYRIDPLLQLGVIPVPPEVVEDHKQAVIDAFCREDGTDHGGWIAQGNRLAVEHGIVHWSQTMLSRHEIGQALATFNRTHPFTPDRSPAPRPLIQLATYVAHQLRQEEPVFAVEYFYTDPILHVLYGHQRSACLGIWDRGQIVHIATYPRPWYRRLWA